MKRRRKGNTECARAGVACVLLLVSLAAGARAVDPAAQRITLALGAEPPNLNSLRTTDQISGFVLSHIKEGLMRYGPDGTLVGGVAESWSLTETEARFRLRADARWSDGRPVTAHDFVFAWQRAVDPATASQYAFILYPIQNAEAINRGRLPPEALGVRAVNDRELVVTLERPCAYFLSLTAFMTYYPIREDFFRSRGERYAADAGDLLFNGPFRLTEWVHGASLKLEKNPRYWDREAVRLNTIDVAHITSDTQAVYRLFRSGSVATSGLSKEQLADALDRGYPIRHFLTGSVFFLEFNHRADRPTAHRKLRQAIQALYDPRVVVNQVIALPGNLPARSLFPVIMRGVEKPFREEYPAPTVERGLARARQLMADYLAETGRDEPPILVLLSGEHAISVQIAEYIQFLLGQGLGIEVRIDQQIFKQRLEKMTAGRFDMVLAGWGPDFNDVITFGDLFSSWNENNRGRYRSAEYDHWVRVAQNSTDPVVRMEAMAEVQRLVIEDVIILPMYESGTVYVQHPQLKGVVRAVFGGDPNYRYAWVAEEATP